LKVPQEKGKRVPRCVKEQQKRGTSKSEVGSLRAQKKAVDIRRWVWGTSVGTAIKGSSCSSRCLAMLHAIAFS